MKTAFITGASSGFGEAIAKALAKQGYNVIAAARRIERLENLQEEIQKEAATIESAPQDSIESKTANTTQSTTNIEYNPQKCGKILPLKLDMRDKKAVFGAVKSLPSEFSQVCVLVNNAGLALGQESFNENLLEDAEVMIDTNIKGVLYATAALLPTLKAQENAYIFNIGSVAGRYPYFGSGVYGGTKAFIRQFSLNLRCDLRASSVRITNIAPGLCKTEFSQVRFKGDKERADAVYSGAKYLSAEDIAQVLISCLALPPHININELEVMPISQSFAGFEIERE